MRHGARWRRQQHDYSGTMYRPTTIVDDSGIYATHTLSNCSDNAVVQTVEVYNVGHFSYLDVAPENPFTVAEYPGAVTPQVDTTRLSWDFCSGFASATELVPPDVFAIMEEEKEPLEPLEKSSNKTMESAAPSAIASFGAFSLVFWLLFVPDFLF